MAWLEAIAVGLGAVAILVASALLVLSRRELSTLFLAVYVFATGVWALRSGGGNLIAWSPFTSNVSLLLIVVVWYSSIVCFALTYPDVTLTRTRRRVLTGVVAAGALVFFVAPLQQLGESLSSRVVPSADGDEYEAYRRFQIDKVALEGSLRDGSIRTEEAYSLANLREEMDLSEQDHDRLETEVRERLGSPVETGSREPAAG